MNWIINFSISFISVDGLASHCGRCCYSELISPLWKLHRRNVLDSSHCADDCRVNDFRYLVPRMLRCPPRVELDDFDILGVPVPYLRHWNRHRNRWLHQAWRVAGHLGSAIQQDDGRLCKFGGGSARLVISARRTGMLRNSRSDRLAPDL